MTTTPRLIDRHPNFVDLAIRTRAGVAAYNLGGADTLDVAYAGTTAMFTVPAGGTFRSYNLRKKRLGILGESNRGLTRMKYDPEEYWVGGGTLPHDIMVSYLRVAEVNTAGVVLPEGPILVVPPDGFFVTGRPSLVLRGTAPALAGTVTGLPPALAMHVVLPQFSDHITFRNEGAADMRVSFDASQPELSIPAGSEQLFDGTFTDLYLRGDGGAPEFSLYLAIVNGELG